MGIHERAMESVQTFGRKKTAVAVAFVKKGVGRCKVNGVPIELVEPEALRYKVWEPILLLGASRYSDVDIRIRVKGGGYTSQIYAIRQALAKALVALYQKFVDEPPRRRSRRSSRPTTGHSSLPIPVGVNQRSSVGVVHVPASRSHTVKCWYRLQYLIKYCTVLVKITWLPK